jgi:hypothetical protein
VPVRGELVPGPEGYEFEVLDADPRRVKKVKIHHGPRHPEAVQQLQAPDTTTTLSAPSAPDITKTSQQP